MLGGVSAPSPAAELARVAREVFDCAGPVTPLAGERDLNGRLETGGERRVLKLHAAGTDDGVVELQDAALAALADAQAPTPRLVASTVDPVTGRRARLLTWLDGVVWAEAGAPPEVRMRALGRTVATVDRALIPVEHPALDRPYRWNLMQAADLLRALPLIDAAPRRFVQPTLERFRDHLLPRLSALPAQAIHNDANEHNVVVDGERVTGLLDVGDVVRAPRVVGLAVAVAYAMLGQPEPLHAVLPLVAGYHAEWPLEPAELALLYDLALTRLALSVANAAEQVRDEPANAAYLLTSQAAIADVVDRLAEVPGSFAHAALRDACGLRAVPAEREVARYLQSAGCDPAPILSCDLRGAPVLDFSNGELAAPSDGMLAIGRYREERAVYRSDAFATSSPDGERRTVHMGMDLFAPAGESVVAPLDGVVEAVEHRPTENDYGGVLILRHETDRGTPFWVLVGHLAKASLEALAPGRVVRRGEPVAVLGERSENGGWAPHAHVQLFTDLLGRSTDLPGVVRRSELDIWESICPDPNLLARLAASPEAPVERDASAILRRRRANLSATLSVSYAEPLEIVDGDGANLVDASDRCWLDLVNNVAHVGHAHPRVVAALADQAGRLNTNTRYLHPLIVEYARRLLATLPDPLSVVFFVNSGSEANDLALRLARTATGREPVVALDWAYHGNLSSLVEISPYKFNRSGGSGRGPRVRVCELADPYRGRFGDDGPRYAEDFARQAAAGDPPAAFIHESIPGVAGQVELATGYLPAAYAAAKAAGAVVIADEVQCGFGRVGDAMWAFEAHGVVPDVVTMGKPIGNGHPLGAVVTTAMVARAFQTGMEYFNTFGGNPVSCAVGLAVLDVIRDERLMAHAATVGARLRTGLTGLMERHAAIGDVRGRGLFLGVDLVGDRATRSPDGARARMVAEGMKRRGILISTDGPGDNVLKIKPPLPLSADDADRVVAALDETLRELG